MAGTMTRPANRMSGIGMTSTRTRARMIERLREQGIRDEIVLAAVQAIPRHIFVDEALAIRAYDDSPLPIGFGQTISQPYVVARMSELVRAGASLGTVLEIGTGCGYQTAVLARIAGEVYTVDRIRGLVQKARRTLLSLDIRNVRLKHGDGSGELGEGLAFDGIVVSAATAFVPPSLLGYLRPGGRLVLPMTQARGDVSGEQRLTVIEKTGSGLREQVYEAVRFVPLLPGIG
jgi:protein-L-isoaspartate(D-aspartate) O-methyltransferase